MKNVLYFQFSVEKKYGNDFFGIEASKFESFVLLFMHAV